MSRPRRRLDHGGSRADHASFQPRSLLPHRGRIGSPSGRSLGTCPYGRRDPSRRQAGQYAGRSVGKHLDHRFWPGPVSCRGRPDAHRRHDGHAPLHEPRAGDRQSRGARPSHRHLFAGRHALRAADARTGLCRQRSGRPAAADHRGRTAIDPIDRAFDSGRVGNDRAQGPGQSAGRPLCHGPGAGRRLAAVFERRADSSPSADAGGAGDEMGPPASRAGDLGDAALGHGDRRPGGLDVAAVPHGDGEPRFSRARKGRAQPGGRRASPGGGQLSSGPPRRRRFYPLERRRIAESAVAATSPPPFSGNGLGILPRLSRPASG